MSLADARPEVAKEWHPTLNSVGPNEVSYGSRMSAWWMCSIGHEYLQRVNNRTAGNQGCPFCSGRRVLKGFNDLATTHPWIADEWSPKNTKQVSDFSAGSDFPALWDVVRCGHTYRSRISRRVAGHGCSVCAGHCVQEGVNDLLSRHPEVAEEWDPIKNDISASKVLFKSSKVFHWTCKTCHYSWSTSVRARVILGSGCPACVTTNNPKVVQVIAEFLPGSLVNQRLEEIRWPTGQRLSVDILWGTHVIEYDGDRWHVGKEATDTLKTKILVENGYKVFRLREGRCSLLNFEHPDFTQIKVKWTLDHEYWTEALSRLGIGLV